MSYPIHSCSSQELLTLLRQGDYDQFQNLLNQYSNQNQDWFRYQLLALRVLVAQKRMNSALRFIESLSKELKETKEGEQAHAEYLFYSWLLEGRTASKLSELEAMLDGLKKPGYILQNLALRLDAMKLQLGLKDANQKHWLINQYEKQISLLNELGLEDEGFFCLQELVEFLITKPFPNLESALDILETQGKTKYIIESPYRVTILKVFHTRLKTNLDLKTFQYPVSHDPFRSVMGRLQEHGTKRDIAQSLAAYGAMLLKYGDTYGRKLINRSIRLYKILGDDQAIHAPVTNLISWLKMTGNQQGVNAYLDIISKPIL